MKFKIVLLLPVFFLVLILNIDWVVVPSLVHRYLVVFGAEVLDLSRAIPELSLVSTYIIAEIISILETVFLYYFFGLIIKSGLIENLRHRIVQYFENLNPIKNDINFLKIFIGWIYHDLKFRGYIDILVDKFTKYKDPENKTVKKLIKYGYRGTFVLSALPETGGRTVALFFWRSVGLRGGAVAVILGDMIKTFYVVLTWRLIYVIPIWKILLALALVAIAAKFLYRMVVGKK